MKNEDIKKLFERRFDLCKDHGDAIASIQGDVKTLLVRQSDWIDKVEQIDKRGLDNEKAVLVLQTQKRGVVYTIGAIASAVSLGVGIWVDHLLRR